MSIQKETDVNAFITKLTWLWEMGMKPSDRVYQSFAGDYEDVLEQLYKDEELRISALIIRKNVHDWWTDCNSSNANYTITK
jgi:hypothetical protein